MSLRVTQECIEILGRGAGTARVTQLCIEALGTPSSGTDYDVSASSTLSLTSAAAQDSVRPRSAESTLSLTSTGEGTVGEQFEVDAESTLTATQSCSSGLYKVSASSTLTLTSTGVAPDIYTRELTSTLTLTSVADQHGPITKDARSDLTINQLAHLATEIEKAATSPLSLTQLATQHGTITKSASSTLTLDHAIDATPEKVRSVTTTIELTQTAEVDVSIHAESELLLEDLATAVLISGGAFSVITLVDAATTNKVSTRSLTSSLTTYTEVYDPSTDTFTLVETGMSQSATPGFFGTKTAHDYLQLTQLANVVNDRADGTDVDATSILSLTSTAIVSIPVTASNTLSLTSTAVSQVAKNRASSTLTLTTSASTQIVRAAFVVESEIEISQAASFVLESGGVLCRYTPFVGTSSDPNAPTPPPTTLPAAAEVSGFRLQYPATGMVTDELVLRAPNLGNIDRLAFDRINRESRGGTLIVYADPIWPKVQTLLLTFSVLKEEEVQALLTFMLAHIGQGIRLIDWEDRAWQGVITNVQDPIVQDRRCSWTASFEFEGERE